MRIPLRADRLLDESDSQPRDATAVVINESRRARVLAQARSDLRLRRASATPDNDRSNVVGVVGDVRNNGLKGPAAPEIYVPRRSGEPDERRRSARTCRPIN
jgi:hypothetical protein